MTENNFSTESSIANYTPRPFPKPEVLSPAEQRILITCSYFHQYGILVRLALFSGLSMSDLLGIQWADLDLENKGLCVQHTLDNFNKVCESFGDSPRFVPLPSFIFKELADWYEDQQDTLIQYQLVSHSNSVAATTKGYQIPPWLMEYFFSQLLQFCKLPKYSFSVLRNTFEHNAAENGTDFTSLSNHAENQFW